MRNKDKLKQIRKSLRKQLLENSESYCRSQYYEDRRERRLKTRKNQFEAAMEEYEEASLEEHIPSEEEISKELEDIISSDEELANEIFDNERSDDENSNEIE